MPYTRTGTDKLCMMIHTVRKSNAASQMICDFVSLFYEGTRNSQMTAHSIHLSILNWQPNVCFATPELKEMFDKDVAANTIAFYLGKQPNGPGLALDYLDDKFSEVCKFGFHTKSINGEVYEIFFHQSDKSNVTNLLDELGLAYPI